MYQPISENDPRDMTPFLLRVSSPFICTNFLDPLLAEPESPFDDERASRRNSTMSQDIQATDPVPHPDGPSGSPVHQNMLGSATTSHDMENLDQEDEEMDSRQYTTEEVEMMFNDSFFRNLAEADNSGQVENNPMDTAGRQEPAFMSEHHGDNTVPVLSEDNYPTLLMDEGSTQLTHLDEGAKNPHGDASVKSEPEVKGENRCQDPSSDYPMGESEHGDKMQSSTLQYTSELLQDVPQDTIMNEEPGYRGHEWTDHVGLGEGGDGTAVQTNQGQNGETVPMDENSIWSNGPAANQTDFEKESQYAVPEKEHPDVQSAQQYGENMAPGTAHQLLGSRSKDINHPSTFTQPVDFWKHRPRMQSGYEGNTTSMTEKETVGQHMQPSNAPMPGLWPTSGMNDIQHQAFGRPIDYVGISASPHSSIQNTAPFTTSNTFSQFQPPTQHFPQQQTPNTYNQSPIDTLFARQQQLQAQVEEKRRQLESARRLHEQTQRQAQQANSLSFAQSQASAPASFLMGPLSYQRAPQGGYGQVPPGSNNSSHWPESQSGSSQSQMVLRELLASFPAQGQEAVSTSIGVNQQTPGPSTAPDQSKTQQQDSEEDSNDKEPLITQTEPRPSITSQTSNPDQPSASQPCTPPIGITSSPPAPTIDWKLPQYDCHVDPTPADPNQPVAKVSLPGLVREEVLLSPDHADQEIHLLLNVFLPGQRALTTPDAKPATAVLNFHTIALMVIEAYVQYEIGDELGRRNPYYAPSNEDRVGSDAEYERIRDARSADEDEIFFAVMDRWRAGRESGKQSVGLIRGIQEFCDVALDVIYYIKEHGLLGSEGRQEQEGEGEGEEQEEEVKSKGKGKGKAAVKEEGVAVLKAKPKGKRAAATEKTETGARKKGKAAVKKEEPKKRGRKPAGGITVVKR
ncbi:hypothetical protein yc1106_00304 [Curvularia clavata]|uniref:Uncharacterized protein n=1 Tax=Curvularia clavata TaxID=95742 RepID=A0A9Q9DNG2_CURCL|nr:hypothetical protein yc1106_00304 [Curvularia clavata]